MLKLYKFFWDCGRMGCLEGMFVALQEDVEVLLGKEIYFGEVLGKHSDISGTLESCDLTVISDDQEKIEWLLTLLDGNPTISGYNPLDYFCPEDLEECEEYEEKDE